MGVGSAGIEDFCHWGHCDAPGEFASSVPGDLKRIFLHGSDYIRMNEGWYIVVVGQ